MTLTQPKRFACLVLKTFHSTDYRGIVAILKDHRELCNEPGLKRVPHFTTLQKASQRLLRSQTVHRLLATTLSLWESSTPQPRLVAVDANGIEAGEVSPYFVRRRRRGQETQQNPLYATTTYTRFPKLNLIGDYRNHLVMACYPTRGPSPDGPDLPRMMRRLPSIETIDQLLADAGYDGEHHHEMLRENYQI